MSARRIVPNPPPGLDPRTGFLTKERRAELTRARQDRRDKAMSEEARTVELRGLCLGAIETMRRFLDNAERQIKEDRPVTDWSGPQDWPGMVVHALGWGAANASTSLQRAVRLLRLPVEGETQEEKR